MHVAVLAKLSCGVYGGPHKQRINADFIDIVFNLLQEEVHGKARGRYFRSVIIPLLSDDVDAD